MAESLPPPPTLLRTPVAAGAGRESAAPRDLDGHVRRFDRRDGQHSRLQAGLNGAVIAIDLTPEMLCHARTTDRAAHATLILADARHLPFASASADAVFAAGLIMHLPDTEAGLRQLARITRPGGLLILFHPSGRSVLAARHGRLLEPDEPLAAASLQRSTQSTGWRLTTYDDAEHRFLAIATRQ